MTNMVKRKMGKKTLILSQQQLDEICGGDSSYFDGLTTNPDKGDIYAKEVSCDGGLDQGYADATTTDDIAHDLTNNWRGNAKLHGMGPITVREWREKYLKEESEHGNQRLNNVKFGAQNGSEGKSYNNTTTSLCRFRQAQKNAQSQNPVIRQKGQQRVQSMKQNWPGIESAQNQFKAATASDKSAQSNKPAGQQRKSRNSGTTSKLPGVFI